MRQPRFLVLTALIATFAATPRTFGVEPAGEIALGQAVAPAREPGAELNLPAYRMNIHLDTKARRAKVEQIVVWTNPATVATNQLVFHVYPRHRPDGKLRQIYERTLESLRVDPRTGFDEQGRRIDIHSIRCGEADLHFAFDEQTDTLLLVRLPEAVEPGQSVQVTLNYELDIPPIQGRFGQYCGVTSLVNWYPVLAYFGDLGWDGAPYLAWHQPFFNEAGNYEVSLTLPQGEVVASGATIVEQETDDTGWQHVALRGNGLRDLAIVASKRYELRETEVDGIRIRIAAFPEHRFFAEYALKSATECIALYNSWFGKYPQPQFTMAESFFGWNGNETAGMVLVDARIFEAPTIGHLYVDHLFSHEICHQWWYGTVGTDGYRESWMDESLVSYLTGVRIRQKYGKEAQVLDWPKGVSWLPNIPYETLKHNGYHLYYGRGGRGKSLAPLDQIGHVHNLFFLVYDRGNKIVGMIHHRLGDERFFEFLRCVYAKYQFRILRADDFQHELELFTGQSWQQFFDDWLRSPKVTDWKVTGVSSHKQGEQYQTVVTVRQQKEILEPVEVAIQAEKGGPVAQKVLLDPAAEDYTIGDVRVSRVDKCEWQVTFVNACRPAQVVVDPDNWLMDSNPQNNRWKCEPEIRFTPLFTPLDETPIVHPIDRPAFVFGPNVDQEGRFGIRGSYISMYKYRVSPFLAYTAEDGDNHLTAGVDGVLYNIPLPNWSLGARVEQSLSSDLYNDPGEQGRIYLRWNQVYTTSFIYENLAFLEFYFRFGDNFFPDEDIRRPTIPGVEDYRDIQALGAWYHVDTRMPYWNPDGGMAFDLTYEHGLRPFDTGESYNRAWSQVSAVRRLPDGLGWFSETKLAGRLAGGIGAPDVGEHFRFGGSTRFRGQRSEDTEGNAFWLTSAEWRFPLLGGLNLNLYDNIANLRSIYASLFYDVGESYLLERSQGVDHAVGAGLYFDVPLLSFVENLTLRLEYGYSLRYDTSVAWFGWYHAF